MEIRSIKLLDISEAFADVVPGPWRCFRTRIWRKCCFIAEAWHAIAAGTCFAYLCCPAILEPARIRTGPGPICRFSEALSSAAGPWRGLRRPLRLVRGSG